MRIVKYLSMLVMSIVMITSCKDDSAKPTIKAVVSANDFLAPTVTNFVLLLPNATNALETFKWTATDFGVKTTVTYKLQMDKTTGDFSSPIELASTFGVLQASVLVGDLNTKLLGLGFVPEQPVNIKLRIASYVGDKISFVSSNVRTITVTPYATSFPSIYGMGAALNGWGPWPEASAEAVGTKYQVNEMVAKLTNGEAFRFFAQADWNPNSYNYPYFTSVDANFVNANDGDSNFKFAGTTGWYKVTVNFNTKAVTAIAVDEPVLYMMGAALNGWGPWPAAAVKMTYKKPGVFEANPTFKVEAFRFFGQADWSPIGYNYPFFTSVDSKFANASDGDSNFKFVGTPGAYKIRVDLGAKTVVNF
jgi:hypothetical protein